MQQRLENLREILRHLDYTRYAAARFLATLSWQMLAVAVGWQTYAVTHDPLALGLVGLVQFVPFFLLVLPAGQIADLADRRLVLIGAYACEAISASVLFWFSWYGIVTAWPIFVAMAFFGAGRAFWMPTGQAMTPSLVPPALFPRAVALNSTLYQTAGITGPALGGFLYLLGPTAVYGTSVVLLLVAAFLILRMRPVKTANPGKWQLSDTLDGLRFVLRKRTVLGAISLDLFAVMFGGATALLPIFAADVLHVGPVGLGVLRTAPGIGAVAMAGWLALHPIERHVGRWMFTGVALFGCATLVFGASTTVWISLAALCVLGASDMVSIYVRHLLVQLETPDEIRGRVSAVSSIFIGSSNELGEFESGVTAKWIGLVPAVLFGGAMTLVVVAGFMRVFPELRNMDRFPTARRS
ncbi:MAG: MFS transporter [Gammaproteobacteria bacterium]|nr:MFS transporter [Gammaproteobacteria bacterium]